MTNAENEPIPKVREEPSQSWLVDLDRERLDEFSDGPRLRVVALREAVALANRIRPAEPPDVADVLLLAGWLLDGQIPEEAPVIEPPRTWQG